MLKIIVLCKFFSFFKYTKISTYIYFHTWKAFSDDIKAFFLSFGNYFNYLSAASCYEKLFAIRQVRVKKKLLKSGWNREWKLSSFTAECFIRNLTYCLESYIKFSSKFRKRNLCVDWIDSAINPYFLTFKSKDYIQILFVVVKWTYVKLFALRALS